jgi:5-hydroxyisourate hydrolase-like protein (transthyretin family)
MAKLLCLLALRAACGWAQTVEGSVFDAATGAAIAGVKVELLKSTTPFYETATDGGGRFRFDNIREGDYSVRYQSPDYWLTAGPTDYRAFHVAAGAPVKLEMRLMPWSRISGRVVDRKRNGVPDAPVQISGSGMQINGRIYIRTSWGGGGGGQLSESPMRLTFMGKTDAEGRFDAQVMPGRYGLSVTAPEGLNPPPPEEGGPVLAWTRSYFPGVALPEAASQIDVLPGAQVADIELKLLAIPARTVRGVVINPDGSPAAKATVFLGQSFRPRTAESNPEGAFEFAQAPEGEWLFRAEAQKGGVKLQVTEWLEVAGHDLENVKLRLALPLNVRAKVVADSQKGEPAARQSVFVLTLRGGHASPNEMDLGPGGSVIASGRPNGDMVFEDFYPGVYRFPPQLQPPTPPYYLDAVRIGEADLVRQDVEISSDAAIAVVYKSDSGTVRGVAEDCASGGVVVIPQDPALRGRGLSRSGPCEANGRYEVRGIRPGDYYALAFAGNGPVLEIGDALLGQAAKVTVRPREASTLDLRAVTRPVY